MHTQLFRWKKIEHSKKNLANTLNLPEKPILIIAAIMIVTAIVGPINKKTLEFWSSPNVFLPMHPQTF